MYLRQLRTPWKVSVHTFLLDLRSIDLGGAKENEGNFYYDRNAKSLKLYYINFKSFSNKCSWIFLTWDNSILKRLVALRTPLYKMLKIRGDRKASSLKLYYTNFKSFSNKSSRIFGSERT